MIIIQDNTTNSSFGELEIGSVFKHGTQILIKTSSHNSKANCFNFTDNSLHIFNTDDNITKVNCTLIIEPIIPNPRIPQSDEEGWYVDWISKKSSY